MEKVMSLYDLKDSDDVLTAPSAQPAVVDDATYDLVVAVQGIDPIEITGITRSQYDEFMMTHQITSDDGENFKFFIPPGVAFCVVLVPAESF